MATKSQLHEMADRLKEELSKLEKGSELYKECHKWWFEVEGRANTSEKVMHAPFDYAMDDCYYANAQKFLNKLSQL